MSLTRVDELKEHPALVEGDECFYVYEAPAQEVARLFFGESGSEPEAVARPRFGDPRATRGPMGQIEAKGLRRLALRVVAHELAQGLAAASPSFGDLSNWTLVPIRDDVPPQGLAPLKPLEPVARLLNELAEHVPVPLDVRDGVDGEPLGSAGVLLFGDALGDGARFRAAREAIQAKVPGCRVVGIFIAKARGLAAAVS